MEKEEDYLMANRQVNIAHVMAGCLCQSCEDMDKYLNKINGELRFENRKAVNEVLNLSHKLHKAVNKLYSVSVFNLNEHDNYIQEDCIHKYYVTLLRLIMICGSDDKTELRQLYMYNYLRNFEPLIKFDNIYTQENKAFYGTNKRLANGEWTMEEARTCIKLKDNIYDKESESETNKG